MKKVKRCYELGDKINELIIDPKKQYEEHYKLVHPMCRCQLTKTKAEPQK